jgi:large subunit ribosomal protein L24
MSKIKKGDDVVVIAGKDKGKRGTVLRVMKPDLVVVEGVNRLKKHQRPNPNKGDTGGIVEMDSPIQVSNIAIYNPATRKADRIGFKTVEGKGKTRCFRSNGELIDA